MPIESAASAHSACSFARKPRPASGNNPISSGVAAQCAAQANDAAAPSRSRRFPAVIASNMLKSFPLCFRLSWLNLMEGNLLISGSRRDWYSTNSLRDLSDGHLQRASSSADVRGVTVSAVTKHHWIALPGSGSPDVYAVAVYKTLEHRIPLA
jgi:hypothetical protein